MPQCCVIGCSSRPEKGFSMKRFPKDPIRNQAWTLMIGREGWQPTVYSLICEAHFRDSDYEIKNGKRSRFLRKDAIPSIFPNRIPHPERNVTPEPSPRKIALGRLKFFHHYAISPSKPHISPAKSAIDDDNLSLSSIFSSPQPIASTLQTPPQKSSNLSAIPESLSPFSSPILISNNQLVSPSTSSNPPAKPHPIILDPSISPKKAKKKLVYFQSKYYRQTNIIKRLRTQLQKTQKKFQVLRERRQKDILRQVFEEDQITFLSRKTKRVKKWSVSTIKKAFKLRFSCGTSGYKELLRQGQPLPSIRTLTRRLEHLKFNSGILKEVIDTLSIKVVAMKDIERDAVLTMDEMSITEGKEYDPSTGKFLGEVTLPQHTGAANHALTIMIGGINSRWKQTVAYYFTNDKTDGTVLKEVILEIIKLCEQIEVRIYVVSSDMGPVNQAVWKSFGISSTRFNVTNSIPHPTDSSRRLFFIADVPHLLKNIKKAFVTHKVIAVSEEIAAENQLPSREAKVAHVSAICEYQVDKELKLVDRLKPQYLEPSHFDKMKVTTSFNVMHTQVAKALLFLVERENYPPEFKTTAWFIRQVHYWFEVMTSRHPVLALSLANRSVYDETIKFLQNFLRLFQTLEFGPDHKSTWKPIQTGVILSTTSVLQLQEIFLTQKKYEFLLTSRFTQDCLENLFSVIRARQPIPTALQFKQHLKLITVAQYMRHVSSSSYSEDDREFLGEFFEKKSQENLKNSEEDQIELKQLMELITDKYINLDIGEENSLYSLAGYIVFVAKKTKEICDQCYNHIVCSEEERDKSTSWNSLLKLKEYKPGCLVAVNEECFNFFKNLEGNFRGAEMIFPQVHDDLNAFLRDTLLEKVAKYNFPTCHMMKSKLIRRFVTFRLRINAEFNSVQKDKIEYGSKSVCMRHLAKTVSKKK